MTDGVITNESARAAGISPARLPHAGFAALYRGVWVPERDAESLQIRCVAALKVLPEGTAISHRTAAVLRGLPMPKLGPKMPEPVHVSLAPSADARVKGLVVHRPLRPISAEVAASGVFVTTVARTWVDLAGSLSREDLVSLGDAILHRNLASREELEAEVSAGGRRRGVRVAREVLDLLEPRSASPMESVLRLLIIDGGLPRPLANMPVFDGIGGWICEPDLQFPPPVLLAIEYESERHRLDPEQWRRDIRRDELMRDLGWIVIRIVAADLLPHRRAATLERIRRAYESRI